MPDEIRSTRAELEPELRIVQIELKTPLRRLAARAKSKSAFRFAAANGEEMTGLHRVLNDHAVSAVHASFRMRHPGQRRRRSQTERDHLSRFIDLHFARDADIDTIVRNLRALPEMEQAVEVRTVVLSAFPADPLIGTSDRLAFEPVTNRQFQWYVFRCGVDRAWARVSGSGVVIADVDGGFFLDHEDLAPNIELEHVFNAVDGSKDVTAGQQDHGTAVLGLAAAASNTLGIAGVAFSAKLWPIQYDAANGAPLPGLPLVNAIDWVTGEDSGGRRVVINIEAQFAGTLSNCEQIPAVNAAIRLAIAKGFVVCVAAGNGDRDAGLADDGTAITASGSILVGATDFDPVVNPRATSGGQASNWGPRVVVSAPGDASHDVTCGDLSNTDYRNDFGGTSGAAAKVAGALALMLEANPLLTHEEAKSVLVGTGSPLNTDKPIGVFLNADAAVAAAFQLRAM
ncbi:MAG: S8 family serine peptidase [Bryobacteraceae bacterium]